MYLIILLFQGVMSILLLVFLLAMMVGMYSFLNTSNKLSKGSAEESKEQNIKDEQINEKVINDKSVESEERFDIKTNLSDTSCLETAMKIDKLEKANNKSLEQIEEVQVHIDEKIKAKSGNKGEIDALKSPNRRTKKNKTRRKAIE